MATNRDLLKEAIADAKAVKETAIANAKLALEEAFTPFLKDQLSAKLAEMDKDDEKEVKEEKEEVEEMDAVSWNEKNNPTRSKSKPFLDPKKVGQGTPAYAVNVNEEEIDEEINLDELLAELDELDEAKNDSKKGNKEEQKRMEGAIRDDRDHIKDLEKDIKDNERKLKKLKADEPKDVNESEEIDEEMKSKKKKEEMDEEMKSKKDKEDMDEEMKPKKKKDDMDEMMKKPMYDEDDKESMKEDERTDAEEEGYLDGMKDEKEDMEDRMDDEEIDLEDMSEDDLKGFIEDVIKDMVSAGEIEPGDEFVEDEVEVEDVEDVDVDVEIDEAKKMDDEDKKKMEEKMSNPVMRKGDDEKKKGKFKPESKPERETEKMREELDATIAEVHKLKDELNEVNLLNAKLLYSNKIFRAKNLNESKKVKVLKAFDKAKDVAQAKTIYETLNEGLLDKSSINENRVKGSASKATGLEPKNSKQPIIESNDVYNRMRQLAGLL